MRLFRLSVHPAILAVAGIAFGALALGASALGSSAPESRNIATYRGDSGELLAPASARYSRFPALYFPPQSRSDSQPGAEREVDAGSFDIGNAEPRFLDASDRSSLIPAIANNRVLAFYGKPGSKSMGILGEYSKEDLATMMEGYARLYKEQAGGDGVVCAFYLIYGTCWPGGEIGYLGDSTVKEYIDYAAERGMLVFVDHQIGKYPVADAVNRLLPWLKYPNVHIALDPEWRTESPMQEIGSVTAEEVNAAEKAISDYIEAEGIQGQKMLVVHQFNNKMISGRERVRADYDGVLLVHTADGFGSPAVKRASYANNARAINMPVKGFKLFFKTTVKGAGYDIPLLLPADVIALDPSPRLIIYQ
jgi:hypothetical protein